MMEDYQYVSDKFGIAFLYYQKINFKCYYFHVSTKQKTYIEVPYTQNTFGEKSVELHDGTIWIRAY